MSSVCLCRSDPSDAPLSGCKKNHLSHEMLKYSFNALLLNLRLEHIISLLNFRRVVPDGIDICWLNVGDLLAGLLARRHFAHRPTQLPKGASNVGSTSLAQ